MNFSSRINLWKLCCNMSLSFLVSLCSIANAAVEMRSAKAISVDSTGQKFSATLKAGFHFNEQAPNQIRIQETRIKPTELKPDQIQFRLPKNQTGAEVILYVCDDEKTYCETHRLNLQGQPLLITDKDNSQPKGPAKIDKNGFIENDFDHAIEVAKQKKLPLFIDFWARWCPGCMRVENEIFSTKEFRKISKNFVKLKIDVDQFANFSISEKYAVRTIPALIVVSSEGFEIDRLLDYQPLGTFEKFFERIEQNPTPMKDLKDPLALALRLYASGRFNESLEQFAKLKEPPPEWLSARAEAARDAFEKTGSKEAYINTLRALLTAEPASTRSLGWRRALLGLLDTNSAESKALVAAAEQVVSECLKDRKKLQKALAHDFIGEFAGYERLLVALYLVDIASSAKLGEAKEKEAFDRALNIAQEYQISPSKIGPALRYLILLTSAKQFEKAEQLASRILQMHPNNSDVKRRKTRVLLALNKFKEAANLAEKILPDAEGRNEFFVAELLAKAYVGLNEKSKAEALLKGYLVRPELAEAKMKASKEALEKLLKDLAADATK